MQRGSGTSLVTALAAGALAGAALLGPAGAASADTPPAPPEWGSIQGVSGTLVKGCGTYSYTYDLHPPEAGAWALEVFVTGPDGTAVAHSVKIVGSDPLAGTGTYEVCKATTPAGSFVITARLSVENGPADAGPDGYVEGMLAPSTYTLTPAPKVTHHKHKKHKHRGKHHRPRHHR